MRVIAHLSDLHFATEDPAIAAAVLLDVARLEPALVVVSGDFTQRARRAQFERARTFVSRLPGPQILVPGNHDVPLFDLPRRFLTPLTRYRRFIGPELEPFHQDDEIAVLGINTARSLTWKAGRISHEQMRRMDVILAGVPESKVKIVVTHHPFIPPSGEMATVGPLGRAAAALAVLDRRGVDLLLAGHIHQSYSRDVRAFYPGLSRAIVAAQAGTAISRRRRNEPNAYNCITIRDESVEVAIRMWRGDGFAVAGTRMYPRA